MESLIIQSFYGGYDQNFVYLITDKFSGEQCLIDAAIPFSNIEKFIPDNLSSLLITHSHGDHIAYLDDISHVFTSINIFSFSQQNSTKYSVQAIRDSQIIKLGNTKINVLHTPGHFPDSVCFLINNALFTGDTLFVGRTGRTISQGSDVRKLYQSVYSKLLTLPKDTLIFPGHNYGPKPTITLGENIQISPLLQAINEQDFIARMDQYEVNR
ncbi:MAG: MBL fold metallo-hydrolase [Candidatus Marinimicrobia bacterium]|nr:MBL fold metallo-hydrolase [Candidatus Neomarinimicrobiota bacterium]